MNRTISAKPYKGIGMRGATAHWYAKTTGKDMAEFVALARRIADQVPKGARVLEVAPGPGYFSIELAKLGGYRITGVDISPTFVEIANRNARNAGVSVDFREGNAAALPFPSESFDFILCRAAFKNFTDPAGALNEMYRVLAPGGSALIIDLRRDAAPQDVDAAVDGMSLGTLNSWITKWTFHHMLLKRAYTEESLRELIARTPFRSHRIDRFGIGLEVTLER